MRISENNQYREMLADLEQSQNTIAKYALQVSSGKKLNAPSDDPLAASEDVGAYADLGTLTTYESAADTAKAGLSVADSALRDIVNQLISAKTAALSAQGSTTTDVQRQAAVATLQSVKEALVSDLNASFQGVYLFSGTGATTAAYTI